MLTYIDFFFVTVVKIKAIKERNNIKNQNLADKILTIAFFCIYKMFTKKMENQSLCNSSVIVCLLAIKIRKINE